MIDRKMQTSYMDKMMNHFIKMLPIDQKLNNNHIAESSAIFT